MNRLKMSREAAGYSQKYVAVTLGVAPPQVSKWEAGTTQPSRKNLKALADLYGVTVDYLLDRAEEDHAPAPAHDPAEAELLAVFRQLNAAGRAALLAAAEGMLAQARLRQAERMSSMG